MKPQKRCETRERLKQFLDEQLDSKEQVVIEEHVGDCAKCQAQLEELATDGRGFEEFRAAAGHDHDISASSSSVVSKSLDYRGLLAPSEDPQMIGAIAQYQVSGVIGQGSTGIVFRAYDPVLRRNVAIKILAAGFANIGSSRQRFERESRAIAAVRDPHVIEVFEVSEFLNRPFIVMTYFPSGSLQQKLEQDGWLCAKDVCCIGMQIAKGLAASHRLGMIHRDIKPANILLDRGIERAVVTDFGLVRVADEATMTFSGTIAGTPQFMSPEQAKGESLDGRSDLFSLGCVLYAACTGRSPFQDVTLMGVIRRVCEHEPEPIREINENIPLWLEAFKVRWRIFFEN